MSQGKKFLLHSHPGSKFIKSFYFLSEINNLLLQIQNHPDLGESLDSLCTKYEGAEKLPHFSELKFLMGNLEKMHTPVVSIK